MWNPISVGEDNKIFFIRVWKPLLRRHILKTLRGSSKGKVQRGQYLLAVGLGGYKWYQSQTSGDVPVRRLSPEGGWTRGGVPARILDLKEGWIGEGNECQQGCWPLKGGGLWDPISVGESPKRTISASGRLGPLHLLKEKKKSKQFQKELRSCSLLISSSS